jgi:putative tryptophan/tyrosine transport system substrate-binding protein
MKRQGMLSRRIARQLTCWVICLFFLTSTVISNADDEQIGGIAVVYPEVGKPYQDIIDSIIQGIRQQAGSSLETFALKGEAVDEKLNPWLEKRKIKVVIALGKQGLEATNKLPNGVQRILGALLSPPPTNEISYAGGILLVPDPGNVFSRIKQLSPKTRRVIVVHDPSTNDWLIQLARQSADKTGLELNAVPAHDLREAAAAYTQLQQQGLKESDLVWLLNDPNTVDQNTILPLLLQASWDEGFVVISNNPSHVKRGVLFALYPDYVRMGVSLGKLAAQASAGGNGHGPISTLVDLSIAVNVRTAEHLNLIYSQKEKEDFDLLFPESR